MRHNKKNDMLLKLKTGLLSACDKCNHTGWIDGHGYADVMCQCLSQFENYIKLDEAGIDREYWNVSFNDWKGDEVARSLVEKYIDKIDVAYEEGLGMVFWGNSGTGKTMLCSIVLKYAMRKNYSVRFITMAELLDVLRKKIADEQVELFYEDNIKNVDFLCIDNLGSEYSAKRAGVSYSVAEFDILARHRRRNLLPTILTTNENPTEFNALYGSSISSLYSGCSKFVNVVGEDYRLMHNHYDEFIK